MIISADIVIDGVELRRYRSDSNRKLMCVEDGNIYPLAYVTRDATVTFQETDLPLNEITAGAIVSSDNVLGLSDFIVDTIDLMDGIEDNRLSVDLGGAVV